MAEDEVLPQSPQSPQPPQPPEIGREFQVKLTQVVGVSVLTLFVLMSLLGVFGPSRGQATVEHGGLELSVSYPQRFRYGMSSWIMAEISNSGSEALASVGLAVDREYLDRFSGATFTPEVSSVREDAYLVLLDELQPGETRVVTVRLQADEFWGNSGTMEGFTPEGVRATVRLSTFVFP